MPNLTTNGTDFMRVGFYISWNIGSLEAKNGNVIGEELLCRSFIKYLHKNYDITVDLYAPNHLPDSKLDIMIYMNDDIPNIQWAAKNIIYLQNGFESGGDLVLKNIQKRGYDGYIFYSHKLFELNKELGGQGIYLPFSADTEEFYPRAPNPSYAFDCAYVGNDIKGKERSERFILPALNYNFGLFGYWPKRTLKQQIKQCLGFSKPMYTYQIQLSEIARGKIPQSEVPVLYSSAKINLNCTIQDCVDMNTITSRTFEVLACKGFLITDKVPIAEELLKDCVVFTNGGQELAEQIEYYLAYPEKCRKIAERGYQYTIKYATREARVKELYDYLIKIVKGEK
ncbi:hypothetical protein FACS1894137_14490 [Spirochaetia bacterium]|nr:hypothetical protein FACS1894137_14490 [Spirochaetia bacterium]